MGWQWHQLNHMQITCTRSRQITTPAPHHSFLQDRCSSWCPTNSVKALKAKTVTMVTRNNMKIQEFFIDKIKSMTNMHLTHDYNDDKAHFGWYWQTKTKLQIVQHKSNWWWYFEVNRSNINLYIKLYKAHAQSSPQSNYVTIISSADFVEIL